MVSLSYPLSAYKKCKIIKRSNCRGTGIIVELTRES